MSRQETPSNLSAGDVLRARARALAAPQASTAEAGGALEVVEFRLADERYAFEAKCVREVVPLGDPTMLPGTPPFVLGIVNVRGQIIPVMDIKRFFDLPQVGLADLHQVIVIERHGLSFGVLADAAIAVRSVPKATLQAGLPTLTGIRAGYLIGVTADRLVVLDADRLALDPAIVVHQENEL